ncbi:siderophore iron transporter mirb [Stagonosporopsis vannaccii]|nr:siderophore iron transporter mirb [Stagonosporopsis vannaccii]
MAITADSEGKAFSNIEESPRGSLNRSTDAASDDHVDTRFQDGIQDIEAVTISWSRISLWAAFVMIWIVYFTQGLISGISSALMPYVTSNFAMHSLTPTTSVISSVVGGVSNLSIAKFLDIFGRPHGFLIAAILATIGLIMSAACNNVEAYAASQVFYTVGLNGVGFSLSVFIADITTLKNRGLVQSICASANIITAWLGGPISTAFLNGAGWRWAFGMESILVPVVTLPLFSLFMYHFFQAKKQGLVPKRAKHGPMHYIREFDVVGLLSLSTGVAFFLLPFNLFTLQAKGWDSPMLICFLVFGIILLIGFGVWEKYFAPVTFIPWHLLRDRTVAGACLLSFTLFFSSMCWGMYYSSILQVVNDLSVTRASYIMSINQVVGFFFAIGIGAFMSYTGRFKSVTLYFAIPISILGSGLLMHFREPMGNIGYIIMCMFFIAVGSGTIMITDEIAILAAVKEQQHFAVAIALVSMFGSIGAAFGLTVSAATWQEHFPKALMKYIPAEDMANIEMIYMDIMTQLSYPVGSPTRIAIQKAYGDAQMYLFVAATTVWVLGVVGTLMWRNIDIKSIKQTKGRVF